MGVSLVTILTVTLTIGTGETGKGEDRNDLAFADPALWSLWQKLRSQRIARGKQFEKPVEADREKRQFLLLDNIDGS